MSDRPEPLAYRLTIQAQPHEVPAVVRLRRALKHLLRWFGLKVVKVEEVAAPPRGPHEN